MAVWRSHAHARLKTEKSTVNTQKPDEQNPIADQNYQPNLQSKLQSGFNASPSGSKKLT